MALSIPELPSAIAPSAAPPWESRLALKIPVVKNTIDPRMAVAISKDIHSLSNQTILYKYTVLYPNGLPKKYRHIPINIVAGYNCWWKNIHCIRYFNSLSDEHQLGLIRLFQQITTPPLRKELNENLRYLLATHTRMSNTSKPHQRLPSNSMTPRKIVNQVNHLKRAAAAQSESLIASGRVGGIINANLLKGECFKCGWERDVHVVEEFEKVTNTVVGSATCVQCKQKQAQQQKQTTRNGTLQNMYNQHLASQDGKLSSTTVTYNLHDMLRRQLSGDDAKANSRLNELLLLFPSHTQQAKVITANTAYSDSSEYNNQCKKEY